MSGPYNQQAAAGQYAGQYPQNTTQSTVSQRSGESFQTQQTGSNQGNYQRNDREVSQATTQRSGEVRRHRHSSGSKGYRRDRENSPTSSTSSAAQYKVNGAEGVSSYQQYSAGNSAAYGSAAGQPYSANADYSGEAGYGQEDNPCGQPDCGGPRREPRHQQQVIRLPDQPNPPTRQVRRRLPTPEPDTIEKVYVQRLPGEVVEEITEVPTTPPPIIKERRVCEPSGPPRVIKRCIRVPPRGGHRQPQQAAPTGCQEQSSNLMSAKSYGSVQQAPAASYQQAPASNYQQSPVNFQQYAGNSSAISSGASFSNGYASSGSYGASGAQYSAPSAQYSAPSAQYSAPSAQYSAPSAQYSAPSPVAAPQPASYRPPVSGFSFVSQGIPAPQGGLAQPTCFYI